MATSKEIEERLSYRGMSEEAKAGLLNWNSKHDAQVKQGWQQFERTLKLKLDAGEKPCSYVWDPTDSKNVARVPQCQLIRPDDLLEGPNAVVKLADYHEQCRVRTTSIKADNDYNKALRADCSKVMSVVQSLFVGTCRAASVLAGAIKIGKSSRVNVYRMKRAIEKSFKPNSTVDVMRLRDELTNLTDSKMSYDEWEFKYKDLQEKLYALGALPDIQEMNQIIIKNIGNPGLRDLRNQLALDSAKHYDDEQDRVYTYHEFCDQAMTLSSMDVELNNWGKSSTETALAVTAKAERFQGCWRCSGDHQVRECEATVCLKCNKTLAKGERHDAKTCTSGGPPSKRSFSKGGDKGGNGGKSKGYSGKASSGGGSGDNKNGPKPSGGALPNPTDFKTRNLKAYSAAIDKVIKERAVTGTKKRKVEWEPEEEG